MTTAKILAALETLKEIVQENPSITHIYFRRNDGVLVDVPVAQAELTAKNHPTWLICGGSHTNVAISVAPNEPEPLLPAKPSELPIEVALGKKKRK